MNLVEGHQRVVRRLDDVAPMELQGARHAVERRANLREAQVQLVRLHGGFEGVAVGFAGIELVLRFDFGGKEFLIAFELGDGVFQLGLVARQRRLRRTRVNREQQRVRFIDLSSRRPMARSCRTISDAEFEIS